MQCPTCYNLISDTSSFCPACGTRLKFDSNIYPNTAQHFTQHQYIPNNYNNYQTPINKNQNQKNMVFRYIFSILTLLFYGSSLTSQLLPIIFSLNNPMSFLSNLFIILFSLFAITTAILLLTKKKIGYYFSKALNMLSSIEGIVSLGLGVLMIIEGIKDSSEYAVLLYILAFLFLVFGATIVALNVVAFIYYSKRKEYFK